MMRRLTEPELSREPARTLFRSRAEQAGAATCEPTDAAQGLEQRAVLLSHLQRVLASELSEAQLATLRPLLEHAIARGLWCDP
jgi:hypothetical protein